MHRLQKQILQVDYYNEAGVNLFYDKALELFYQEIRPEMVRILDKHNSSDKMIKIDSLTIDFGVTYETDLRNQWLKRFREEFEKELLIRIELIKNGLGAPQESIDSVFTDELDILVFYLQNGVLPWNGGYKDINIPELFDNLLAAIPAEVDKRLRAGTSNDRMIRRIVLRFSDRQIENLIKVMQPSESAFIIQSAYEIKKAQQRDRIVKSGNREFRDAIWNFILAYIINDRGSYFDTREYLSYLLHKIASHFNIHFSTLIQEIYKSIYRLKLEPVRYKLGILLEEIYQSGRKSIAIPGFPETGNSQVQDFLLTGKMERSVTGGDKTYYKELLTGWMTAAPLDLGLFLSKKAGEEMLQRIVSMLPDPELRLLVKTVAPAEAPFIIIFQQDIVKQQEKLNYVNTSVKQFKTDLWVILLGILLNSRGSVFNQKVFVLVSLEKLSKHYNLNPSFFIENLLALIDEYHEILTSSALYQLFVEIRKEFATRQLKKPIGSVIPVKHYFEYLEAVIAGNAVPGQAKLLHLPYQSKQSITFIIRYLIKHQPETLKSWILKNLTTESRVAIFFRDLDTNQAKGILELWMGTGALRLMHILKVLRGLRQKHAQLKQAISEPEVFRMALGYYVASRHAPVSEAGLYAAILTRLAKKMHVEVSRLVDLFIEEASKMPELTTIGALRIMSKTLQHLPVKKKIITRQKIGDKKIVASILHNEHPFLKGYLDDLEKILDKLQPVLPGITFAMVRYWIIRFSSSSLTFNQYELTAFLVKEISRKAGKSATETRTLLFEQALSMQRSLSSTLILSLGSEKDNSAKASLSSATPGESEPEAPDQRARPVEDPQRDESETLYIANAGLVLLNPFIPALFERSGLVKDRAFTGDEAKEHAVHLLQYCVDSRENADEFLLGLPKILCGMDPGEPVRSDVTITESEKDLVHSLLKAVIDQWKIIGNTSVEGLQQSFLERNGALRLQKDRWELEVEKRSFDVLLDQIPWTYSLIKLPWMLKPVYTLWR
jgi:hypothetical protein